MKLSEKRCLFTLLIAKLIIWGEANGYNLAADQFKRTEAEAKANAKSGAGISNSLHLIPLAGDLLLYINGVYQTDSEAYRPLGEYWKSLHPLCCWGGDFKKQDGNHFSLEHNGVK